MRCKLEDFGTGLVSIQLGVKRNEIRGLIDTLRAFVRGDLDHAHIRQANPDATAGVLDIEIGLAQEDEPDDLILDVTPPTWPDDS